MIILILYDKLYVDKLPDLKDFYSLLSSVECSNKDYTKAQIVFSRLSWHLLYRLGTKSRTSGMKAGSGGVDIFRRWHVVEVCPFPYVEFRIPNSES